MPLAGEVTNPSALEARDVSFQSDGAPIRGYLARPKAPGTYPAVIILHEAFGLVEHERDVARRFANAGFIALAPDVYSRVGAPKNASDISEVWVVEVYYNYMPITPLPKFITGIFGTGGMIIGSKSIF